MKISFASLNIKEDLDRLKIIHWAHFYIVFCALLAEIYHGILSVGSGIIELSLLTLLYRFYFKTAKELYYSFWTFSVFLGIYLLIGIVKGIWFYPSPIFFYLYLLAIIFLSIEVYILFSPIYYPIISWWEYDFRYRDELKIITKYFVGKEGEKSAEGRLTDLRRHAGCVVLLKKLPIGEVITIEYENIAVKYSFTAKVISCREPLVGRGFVYGVKFYFKDEMAQEEFDNFVYLWKVDNKMRKRKKYLQEADVQL